MEDSIHYRPTQAVVDLEAIRDNVRNLKDYLGAKQQLLQL